jgi:RNA polymerase sigma factor (sigma-70 family)
MWWIKAKDKNEICITEKKFTCERMPSFKQLLSILITIVSHDEKNSRNAQMIILKWYAGLSYRQVARLLGCSHGTVRRNEKKMIENLREGLTCKRKK